MSEPEPERVVKKRSPQVVGEGIVGKKEEGGKLELELEPGSGARRVDTDRYRETAHAETRHTDSHTPVMQQDGHVGSNLPDPLDGLQVEIPHLPQIQHAPRLIEHLKQHHIIQLEMFLNVIDVCSHASHCRQGTTHGLLIVQPLLAP